MCTESGFPAQMVSTSVSMARRASSRASRPFPPAPAAKDHAAKYDATVNVEAETTSSRSDKARHDFSGEGTHPRHKIFNGGAEVGTDVLRPSFLERSDLRKDRLRVANERRASAQLDSAALRVKSHLLGLDAEFVWLQSRRLPDIPKGRGASECGVG